MAIGDKLVTLDGLKAVYQDVNGNIVDLKSAIVQNTQNIWLWGDQTVTGGVYVINKDAVIPGGEDVTYTLSAEITRASTANCRMYFYKNSVSSSNKLAEPYLSGGPQHTRNSVTFSLPEDANIVIVASGPNTSNQSEAQWKNIQLELGSTATDYIKPCIAVDSIARATASGAETAAQSAVNGLNAITPKLLPVTSGILSLEGKNVAIIGDSINTNGDYDASTNPYGNVPEIVITEDDVGVELSAYLTKKDVDGGLSLGGHTFTSSEIGTEVTFTPVDGDVGKMIGKPLNYYESSVKTWWEILQEQINFTPIPVCWSGASMTSHEGMKDTYKTSYAWHDATIRKCGIRTPGGSSSASARTAPDMVIIFRGANDMSHPESQSADPLVFRTRTKVTDGEIGAYPGTYPDTDKAGTSGAYTFGLAEAIEITVKKLRDAYPHTVIVLCTINSFIRLDVETYPMRNSVNTLPEYNETIRKVANVLGCPLIDFDKDGMTFENVSDYTVDMVHPTADGHAILAKRAMIDLAKINEFAVE